MDIAYKGEQRTRSRCGRLDQVCAFGSVPVFVCILTAMTLHIEEICLVIGGEDELRNYQNILRMPIANEHFDKLSESMKNYEQTIQNIGNKINFRIQKERFGFGYAVYQCRDFCDNEPALLLLGDTIYTSKEKRNCTQQLIELYNDLEKP